MIPENRLPLVKTRKIKSCGDGGYLNLYSFSGGNGRGVSREISGNQEGATLTVSVQAGTFSATAPMDIDVKSLPDFCNDLKRIYDTLSGSAKISEPYGERYLSFCGDGKGHVAVSGYLYNRSADGFYGETSFESVTDQTFLPRLIRWISDGAEKL